MRRLLSSLSICLVALGGPLSAEGVVDLFTLELSEAAQAVKARAQDHIARGEWALALPLQEEVARHAEALAGPLHLVAIAERVQHIRLLDNTNQDEAALERARALHAMVIGRYSANSVHAVEPGLVLADLLSKSGRAAEALPIALGLARMTEGFMGKDDPATALLRFQAVQILDRMGYRDESIAAYAQIYAVLAAAPGADARGIAAGVAVRRGYLLEQQGDWAGAAEDYARANELNSRVKGARHPETLATRRLLARALFETMQDAEFVALLEENLPVVAEVYGPDSPEFADWQRLRAMRLQVIEDNPQAALPVLQAAVAVLAARMPPGHRLTNQARLDLARLHSALGDHRAAWDVYETARADGLADRKLGLDFLWFLRDAGLIDSAKTAELALPTLQAVAFGAARGAVSEQTRRLMLTTDAAREAYRQASDLRERRNATSAAIVDLASKPREAADQGREAALRRELADLTAEMDARMAEVHALEPGFAAMTGTDQMTVGEIRAALGPDEVFVLVDHQRHDQEFSFVLAISREKVMGEFVYLPVAELQAHVAAIRDSVALRLGTRAAAALDDGAAPSLDGYPHEAAWQLFVNSFLMVHEALWQKPHVLVDLRGPMTGLPPHLLLYDKPAPDQPLSSAPFLLREHAFTVLPSVAALRAAALAKGRPAAPEAFAGFADPAYELREVPADLLADAGGAGETRLRGALAPLPETAGELALVAAAVAGDKGQLWLGERASEATAKSADLARYRMVYFATHGLVGGDRSGTTLLTEAALALTPGQGEDGFLTASEIAQMRFNADWVVLSACNTAVGNTPGAEALSGLAQAFLYAGARGLIVSHWPVESRSAAHLMTETFRLRAQDASLGPAEAQRRAMLAMIEGGRWAHPAYWAPFVMVGAGE